MRRNIIFLSIALLILAALSIFFWFFQVKNFIGRADISSASFSIDNSYLFVSPLRAKAKSEEQIRITIFLLDGRGLGVLGKTVSLISTNPALVIKSTQATTDSLGKAFFDVSSSAVGDYYLEVRLGDRSLLQKAHLSFY